MAVSCRVVVVAAAMALGVGSVRGDDHRVTIAPGVNMPIVNFGGYIPNATSNFTDVLIQGGRGLDTALTYDPSVQKTVGAAVKWAVSTNTVPRSDIFLTTKIPCCPTPFPVEGACAQFTGSPKDNIDLAFKMIDMDKVDLLLLHWPCSTMDETMAAYSAMEDALAQGRTRAIGISNFNASLLDQVLARAKVKPAVNQCDHSVGVEKLPGIASLGGDEATVKESMAKNVTYWAYAPLGGSVGINVMGNPVVKQIAQAHNVGPAQVALRYLIQRGMPVVTAADKTSYILEDLDVFSFNLTAQEISQLEAV